MITNALRRTAVLAALATASAGLVFAPAQAADTQPTSLSIRAVKARVAPGGHDQIRGWLAAGSGHAGPGETVTLEAREKGEQEFTPIGVDLTGDKGGVGVKVEPSATTYYRWVFAGDDELRGSRSGVVVVRVKEPQHHAKRLATSLSVRALRPRIGLGESDTIVGRLRSHRTPLAHKLIVLLAKEKGADTWSFSGTEQTKSHGQVSYGVQPDTDTRYRLAFLGSADFRPARSGVVHVAVRDNSLTISATPRRVEPGESSTVSGVLSHLGQPYAGQSVELRAKPKGADAFETVATQTSGADGSVSFAVTPAMPTRYVLVLPASDAVTSTRSKVVKVSFTASTALTARGHLIKRGYVVSGRLTGHGHALHRRIVSLEKLVSGEWQVLTSEPTNKHGRVSFLQPSEAGASYRLSFAGGPAYSSSTSGVVVQ